MTVHFSVREAINTGEETGNIVTATSDVACHLWMRWTYLLPRIHSKPVLRRGMWLNDDVRFCFDVFTDVEQDESGDTTTHTFTLAPCVTGRHFWYYFWGYIAGVLSPSTSIIMQYQPGIECPPILRTTIKAQENNRTIRRSWGDWFNTHDHPNGTVTAWHDPPGLYLLANTGLTASYWVDRAFLQFDTSVIPAGSSIVDARLILYCKVVTKSSQVVERHIIATQGVQDTPVIPTNYGDQLPITVNGGQVHLDDCTVGETVNLILNAAGRAWVVPDGLTRLCIRQQLDFDDISPVLGFNNLAFESAQEELAKSPRLVIQYEPPL